MVLSKLFLKEPFFAQRIETLASYELLMMIFSSS
jgi:hypothetical protein